MLSIDTIQWENHFPLHLPEKTNEGSVFCCKFYCILQVGIAYLKGLPISKLFRCYIYSVEQTNNGWKWLWESYPQMFLTNFLKFPNIVKLKHNFCGNRMQNQRVLKWNVLGDLGQSIYRLTPRVTTVPKYSPKLKYKVKCS